MLKGGKETGNWWTVGLSIVLLSNLIIILLPALRDYALLGRSDHLSHLGMVKDIIQFGSFGSNIYPVTHTLISQLSLILNIPSMEMMHFIGPLFYLLFVAFTYLLCREILPRPAAILATLAGTVLFSAAYTQVSPFAFSVITFPFVFFVYFRGWNKPSVSLRLLLISWIVLMALFHVVTSLVLTLSLLIMELSKPLFNRLFVTQRKQESPALPSVGQTSLGLVAISFIVLMLWAWNNYSFWNHSVLNTFYWFRGELLPQSVLELAAEGFAKLGLGPLDQLELLIRGRGHQFIYFVLALVATIMLIRRRISLPIRDTRGVFLLSIVFWIIALIQAVDYFRPVTFLSSGRIIAFVIALFPPLVGLALYLITGIERQGEEMTQSARSRFHKGKITRGIVITLIIIVCSIVGIFVIYPSPAIFALNIQITHMEVAGEGWFLDHQNPEIEVMRIHGRSRRFKDALLGRNEKTFTKDSKEWMGDHFHYDQYQSFGESFTEDRYLVLNEYAKLLYIEVWPTGRFTWDDFDRLEDDPSVDKLYANGEMDVWYVVARRLE